MAVVYVATHKTQTTVQHWYVVFVGA